MSAELDTGWTYERLIREVAEKLGLADQTGTVSAIPSDPNHLDQCKRAVNRGYHTFIRLFPQGSFRNRRFTITTNSTGTEPDNIDGDAAIYRLPRWLTRKPSAEFQYTDRNFPFRSIVEVTRREIVAARQLNPNNAPPRMYQVQPIDARDGMNNGAGGALQVTFYPTPNAAYTLESGGYVYPYDLIEMGERHIAGAEHDLTIAALAVKEFCDNPHEDPDKRRWATEEAASQLALSREIEKGAKVGNQGRMSDPRMRQFYGRDIFPGDSSGNFTYNGNPLA